MILVTGSKGQLGHDVVKELKKRRRECLGVDVEEMDITDEASVARVFDETRPDAVIHCAAYTAVDAAEDNAELCFKINALGTENIAKAAKKHGSKLLYLSTDYVFNGRGTRPWEPEDPKEPLNAYGRSKYEGERIIKELLDEYFIVRISWVFGINGKNFVKTMLKLSETRDTVSVVNDQVGSPTYTYDLARLLADMIETDKYGEYHATNEGEISWYEFAKAIFAEAGINMNVLPVTSDQYPAKARRPENSRMSKKKLLDAGFTPLPRWEDALARYIKELKGEANV